MLLCGPQRTLPLISDGSAILTSEGVGLRVYDLVLYVVEPELCRDKYECCSPGFLASSWYTGYLSKLLQRGI